MPIALGLYFVLPWRKAKNVWLLVVSLVFYAWGEPVYVLLMVASIVGNWLFALGVGDRSDARRLEENAVGGGSSPQAREDAHAKVLLVAAVVFNVCVIGFFKYEGFLAQNINALAGSQLVPDLQLPLPIGISFYTLQALSYVVDVYRGEVAPQRNVLFLGMYVACFPQLIAGPIVRYSTIADQILHRRETLADFSSGLRLFIVGLGKKVLLANVVAILADSMLKAGGAQIGAVGAWGGLVAYTFQIYFDFSGYSDMAIGLGRMMGFKYLRNFNYPYIATSARGFWRRWHISLSTFFRDYVYIPLGGSRVKTGRWVVNMAVVWALTGVWHGAAWNFVLWGVYWGVLLVAERLFLGKLIERLPRLLQHLYCIALFVFSWSFFWIGDLGQLIAWWQAMFGAFGLYGQQTFWQLGVWSYWPVFAVCILASTPVAPWVKERLAAWTQGRKAKSIFEAGGMAGERTIEGDELLAFSNEKALAHPLAAQLAGVTLDLFLFAVLVLSCMSVVSGSFNPFIYFQF